LIIVQMINRMTLARSILLGMSLAAIYYFLWFDPGTVQKNAIAAAQQQIEDIQNQIKDNQAKLDRAAIYKKTAAEIGTTINRLLGVIPERFGISDLMKIISNEAKVAGSSLVNITPGNAPEVSQVAKEFEELSVKLELSGSFLQHMIFLSNLTKINQILIVRKLDLNLTKEAKGEDLPTVQMLADIIAYRYRGAQNTPPTGGKPAGP
jgi:Tfp pilus assembly protein PilO